MKINFIIFILFFSNSISSQNIEGFESFGLTEGMVIDGSMSNGYLNAEYVRLENTYSDAYGYIGGWAISADTDTQTPGFLNQFSSANGSGAQQSLSYALGYAFDPIKISLNDNYLGHSINGMFVNNNTFAYLSMKDGDGFSKKFGGLDGSDPDFFLLKVNAYYNGEYINESVDFYLADFRSDDSSEDYIISDWEWLDLSALGPVDSLEFSLVSSDNGQFGMNTPAYFCIDEISFNNVSNTVEEGFQLFEVFPNPSIDNITIHTRDYDAGKIQIYDMKGVSVISRDFKYEKTIIINVEKLEYGSYILTIEDGKKRTSKIIEVMK